MSSRKRVPYAGTASTIESVAAVGIIRAQLPARCRKQLAKLFFGALASAGENQHLQVEELARRELVARLNHAVNHQEFAARIHAFLGRL